MRTRTTYRHVVHKIIEHPDTDVTHGAECLHCGWSATSSTDSKVVDVACMEHTGRSNHKGFRRIRTSFEMVVRAE
ncbi:hypothetical protein ACQEVS_30565 [Streptomyces sp. CA-181903]|uniref:DUF7848 domain-containing protein n=1 Tax=Streptomyces sp. CA-181903 TaxID=3240055 RepID=UPI003D906FF1